MKTCQCGSEIAADQSCCITCALETAAELGASDANIWRRNPSAKHKHRKQHAGGQLPHSARKLPEQAERLVTFLEGEWPYPKCFDYLRLLNVEQRRSLWEDIDFQLKEEAQGRSGQDSLEGALAKASTSLELVPLPRQPFRRSFCSRCGTKVTQAYHDLAEPELIMWLCSRCFERGGPWRRPERPPAPESFVMPRRRFG